MQKIKNKKFLHVKIKNKRVLHVRNKKIKSNYMQKL